MLLNHVHQLVLVSLGKKLSVFGGEAIGEEEEVLAEGWLLVGRAEFLADELYVVVGGAHKVDGFEVGQHVAGAFDAVEEEDSGGMLGICGRRMEDDARPRRRGAINATHDVLVLHCHHLQFLV